MPEDQIVSDAGAGDSKDPNITGGDDDVASLKANRDKILSEKRALATKAKEQERTIADLEAKLKGVASKDLEAKGDLKQLLDLEREAKAKLEGTVTELSDKLSKAAEEEKTRKKFASVLQAFDGGLDKRWWGLVDIDQVVIDPDTGQVDKASVDKLVTGLKAQYPEMIRGKTPGMPKTASQTAGQSIGYEAWKALSSKEQAKWKNEQIVLPR